MTSGQDSSAVALARANVEAWNNHDFAKARAGLAPDVHVTAVTTLPGAPLTDLTGIDDYMQGLMYFAQTLKPGSVRELASLGDERNALLMLAGDTTGEPFGEMTWTGARLYQFDDEGRIKVEHIVFCVVPK
jgi:SnoaL-like protein